MAAPQQSTRPLAVTIVVLFIIVQMVVAVFTWFGAITALGINSFDDFSTLTTLTLTPENFITVLTAVVLPLLELYAIVVIIGLLKMKWWALTGAMLLQGLILTLALLTFLRGETVAARNVIGVINVLLLNQLPVRRAFGERVGLNE